MTRCVVIERDPSVRALIHRAIQVQGLSVTEVATGREALAALEVHPGVPLVIYDFLLPDLDGLAFLRQVVRGHPDTAVLVMAAGTDVTPAVECLREGAADYFLKPVTGDELQARVMKALEKRRLVLENRHLQQTYKERLEESIRGLAQRNKEMFVGQIQMAVRMLEAKDIFTRGHSQRVRRYAERTAVALGFTGDILDQIMLGGDLHDIGKIGTREALLTKPGPLTDDEFLEIQRHVLEGEEILEPLRRDTPVVLQIVRSHHERVDGSGFPDQLSGEQIPLPARIISVVDAFDVMTMSRAYRPSRTPRDAMKELIRCIGVQFDSQVVRAFQRVFPDVDTILGPRVPPPPTQEPV